MGLLVNRRAAQRERRRALLRRSRKARGAGRLVALALCAALGLWLVTVGSIWGRLKSSAPAGGAFSRPLQRSDAVALVEQRLQQDLRSALPGVAAGKAAAERYARDEGRACDVTLFTVYTLADARQYGEGFAGNAARLRVGELAVCHRLVSAVAYANRLMEGWLDAARAQRRGYALSTELTEQGDVFSVWHDVVASSRSEFFMHWEIEDRKPLNNIVEKVWRARAGAHELVVSPVETFDHDDALKLEIDTDLAAATSTSASVGMREHTGYHGELALSDLFQYDDDGRITGMSGVSRNSALFSAEAYTLAGGIKGRSEIADQCLFATMKLANNISLGFTSATLEFRSIFRSTVKTISLEGRSHVQMMREECTPPEELEAHGLFNNAAYRRNEAALAHPRVALFHEMMPRNDQGGNIRLRMIINGLLANGFQVDIFTRQPLHIQEFRHLPKEKQPTFHVLDFAYGAARVFADDPQLSIHLHKLSGYHVLMSGLWFWRDFKVSTVQPIPLLVQAALNAHGDIPHVVISDDIHYERCRATEKDQSLWRAVEPVERSIWANADFIKVFVSAQDMRRAANEAHLSPEQVQRTMTILPYMLQPRRTAHTVAHTGASGKFDVVYFGNAHPANIEALEALVASAAGVADVAAKLAVHVVGDDKWAGIIKRLKRTSRSGLDIRAEGFVEDLDELLDRMDLAILPVVVGGTGISSKIFKCIESGTPFVSTYEGKRGFDCDLDCVSTFFTPRVAALFDKALHMLRSPESYRDAVDRVSALAASLDEHNLAINGLLRNTLRLAGHGTPQRGLATAAPSSASGSA